MRRLTAGCTRAAMLYREWPFCATPARTCGTALSQISMKATMWRYRDGPAPHRSHIGVVRPAAPLRGNPGNVLVRILDVAGFAVDAVLRVDHEFREAAFLHPFIDASRAVPRGGACINVVLGLFLQLKIDDAQMDRLILFMIGIRQKYRRKPVKGQLSIRLGIGDWCAFGRGLERRIVRLAMPERAKDGEAKRIRPHIEPAKYDSRQRAEL